MYKKAYKRTRSFATFIAAAMVGCGLWLTPGVCAEQLSRGLFTIEYAAGHLAVAERTLDILEDAVVEYDSLLPVGERPIHVKIIAVSDEFKRYAAHFSGLDISGLARPGEDLIIVKAPRLRMPGADYPGTLRHELVHLLLYRNVNPAYLPQWLNEGLAMSLANEYRWQAPFYIARMFVQNRIIPYHKLDRAFFIPGSQEQFGDAYAQSLSMTRYLRNRLGEEQFWQVVRALRDMPFPQALTEKTGLSIQQFWREYERSLWKYAAIAAMASGFFFQPAAILLIVAYLRRRRIARGLYQRWEQEEAEEVAGRGRLLHWEEIVEEPDAWMDELYDEDTW